MSKLDHSGIEIIKDKFYFTTFVPSRPDNSSHYFTVEDELTYEPFFADFGPLNLGHVYSYCHFLEQKLKDENINKKKIYHYAGVDGAKRTNAVYLIGAYCVLVLRWSAESVYRIFVPAVPLLLAYRDASVGASTFGLTVLECWKGLVKATSTKFFDLNTFDPNEYYFYERVENGDMNWIVPGKFLAFSGPHASHHSEAGLRTLTPEDYIPYFKKHNVGCVVRLNKKVYDKKRFVDYGVKHHDLYFVDGSTPSDSIVQRFLEIVENETGAIAVHCKAGLGRTGTLIGCSLMKHHKFTAHEAIAWLRICRPGSVIGPQQHFLTQVQGTLWKDGDLFRKKTEHTKNSKAQLTKTIQTDLSASASYDLGSTLLASTASKQNHLSSNGSTKGPTKTSTTSSITSATTTTTTTITNNSIASGTGPSADISKHPTPPSNNTRLLGHSNNTYDSGTTNAGYPASQNSANTKERLKADMRLITATLKSMRTTPPTSPTLIQSPPKFTAGTPTSAELSPYATSSPAYHNNNALHTLSNSNFHSGSSLTNSGSSNSTLRSTSPSHSSATPLSSSGSSNGPTLSASSSSSSSSAITSFYLNSPYAPASRNYSPSRASNVSTKSKSPSGLSLQHRKIENQANRAHETSSRQPPKNLPSSASKPATRGASPTFTTERHVSPAPSSALSRSLLAPSTTTTTTTTTKPPPTYHRKSRSSGNLLSSQASQGASPSYSSQTSNSAYPSTRLSTDFTMVPPSRSLSNGPPSSYFPSHSYNYPAGTGNFASLHLNAQTSSVTLRSKTPPPRRHSSVSKNTNYPGNDAYQKKSDLRLRQ